MLGSSSSGGGCFFGITESGNDTLMNGNHIEDDDETPIQNSKVVQRGVISFNKHNMLAYSTQNKIFVMDPNDPTKVEKIPSNHMYDEVRGLNWQLSQGVGMLLSHDKYNTITLWKCVNQCVNDYHLRKTFYCENVLCCKWCDNVITYINESSGFNNDTTELESRYTRKYSSIVNLPSGTRSFIAITSHGEVLFYFYDHSKYKWVTSSIQLNLNGLVCADFTILEDGKICVVCSERDSATIHVAQLAIERGRNVDTTLPNNLILISRSCFSIDGLVAGLYLVPYKNRILIKSQKNKYFVYCQHPKRITLKTVMQLAGDPTKLDVSKDATHHLKFWKEDKHFSLSTKSEVVSVKTSIDGNYVLFADATNLYVYKFCPDFLTFKHYQTIDIRNQPEELILEEPINNPQPKKRKITEEPSDATICDMDISPNGCVIAVLDTDMKVRLFPIQKRSNAEYINMLNLCLVNNYDKWDLFASLKKLVHADEITLIGEEYEKSRLKLEPSKNIIYIYTLEMFIFSIYFMGSNVAKRGHSIYMQSMVYAKTMTEVIRTDRLIPGFLDKQVFEQTFENVKKFCDEKAGTFRETNALLPFVPFSNWCIRLLLFLKKAATDLVSETGSEKKHGISVYFLSSVIKSKISIDVLKELSLYAYVISLVVTHNKVDSFLFSQQTILQVVQFYWTFANNQQLKTNPLDVDTWKTILQSSNFGSNEYICQYSTQQYIEFLDLSPNFRGFLFKQGYDILPHKKYYDCITKKGPIVEYPQKRQPNPSTSNIKLKECKFCGRISTYMPLTPWAKRFSVACVICGSNYKRVTVDEYLKESI